MVKDWDHRKILVIHIKHTYLFFGVHIYCHLVVEFPWEIYVDEQFIGVETRVGIVFLALGIMDLYVITCCQEDICTFHGSDLALCHLLHICALASRKRTHLTTDSRS